MNINVDPGSTAGVAIYSGPSPAVTSIKDATVGDVRAVLGWCQRTASDRGEPLQLQLEDQYVEFHYARGRKGPTINLPSLMVVIRSAELWRVIADDMGIEWCRTYPRVWQAKMFKSVPDSRNGKKLSTKQKATLAVAATWKKVARFKVTPDDREMVLVSRLNEHERDAMLMGRWRHLYGDSC